ncbi:hypothetical protein Fuma_03733 [Fuerstiella marisgermanici]|uniref:Uncharacterized protein n=1 Tax=Fuerstiella marisgermanici TaxID=1891926 RepID=A0A1P8WJ73_9PLAN|nr:hypothetical protein Fuma_03733 [Fuerstiella marisgermanici]
MGDAKSARLSDGFPLLPEKNHTREETLADTVSTIAKIASRSVSLNLHTNF